MRKFIYGGMITMTVALVGFAIWFALSFGNSGQNLDEAARLAALNPENVIANPDRQSPLDDRHPGFFVQSEGPRDVIPRISSQTRIIYDYYQPQSGGFDTIIEYPAHFLLDMTHEELAAMFADWQVLYFSPYQVHLRQNSQVEYRLYVIGVHEGYIAVFYDDEYYIIKELTSRPITALAMEEQQRLLQGIRVTGAEELLRALEDFSS
jgi:hypothetical protein